MNCLVAAPWWGLLQTAIGAAAAIGGGAFASWFTWQHERQSIASAIAAEVQGFIDILERREARTRILQGWVFPIGDGPFPVFGANASKIGYLPVELAARVVTFYTHAAGIAQDFNTLWEKREPIPNENIFRERLAQGLVDLKAEFDVLLPELRKEAERDWKQVLQPTN